MNNETLKYYKTSYNKWGKPQLYKDLKLYPIKIGDEDIIELFYALMAYPKNCVATDKRIIKMSYLKYILLLVCPYGIENTASKIIEFLKYITQEEDLNIVNNKDFNPQTDDPIDMILKIKIGDKLYDESDFDNMREIILEQNNLSIEYVEEYNEELEKLMKLSNTNSDITFEDELFTFANMMNKIISELQSCTLYQIIDQIDRKLRLKQFDIYKPLEAGGTITLKSGGEIPHYLYHIDKKKGRYSSILINQDKFMKDNEEFLGTKLKKNMEE